LRRKNFYLVVVIIIKDNINCDLVLLENLKIEYFEVLLMSREGIAEFRVSLPKALVRFLKDLVEKEIVASAEEFIAYATRTMADQYGFSGFIGGKVKTSELVTAKIEEKPVEVTSSPVSAPAVEKAPSVKKAEISDVEASVLDAFGSSSFMFADELYIKHVFAVSQAGKKPFEKNEFIEGVESLERKGMLEKYEKEGKTFWKVVG
jgi:Arc/MetJ-type ribon-helix-helix transcriptional regulator